MHVLLVAHTIDKKRSAIFVVTLFVVVRRRVVSLFTQDSLIDEVHFVHVALHVIKILCELHNSFHPNRQLVIMVIKAASPICRRVFSI